MPTPATLLLIGSLLPMGAFALLLFFGRRMNSGAPRLPGYIASVCLAGSFICSLVAMMVWVGAAREAAWGMGHGPIHLNLPWLAMAPAAQMPDLNPLSGWPPPHWGYLTIGLYVDSLTIAIYSMVALVGTLACIFAIGFLADEAGSSRFFLWMSLMASATLGLAISESLMQMFIAWEVIGFSSYMLIGFWRERKAVCRAALKVFCIQRLGDCGFLIGLGILASSADSLSLPRLWTSVTFSSPVMQSVAGLALFVAAMTAAAQFPLHAWISDAMEAPAPANALMQSAVLSTAGVYLLARVYPLLTIHAKFVIAVVGCLTLAIAALMALAQMDLKKLVACAIVSQLGYVMLAIGIGSWTGAMFHLITNAFAGGLLFLAAGSVVRAARGQRDMRQFGGLFARLPVTAICFAVGVLAIAGAGIMTAGSAAPTPAAASELGAEPAPPPNVGVGFSEYYSRNLVLEDAAEYAGAAAHSRFDPLGPRGRWWFYFFLPVVMSGLIALAMMRAWMLTFAGSPRNGELAERARERPIMWAPMLFLAGLSVIAGSHWFGVRELLENAIRETVEYCRRLNGDFAPVHTTGLIQPATQQAVQETIHQIWWVGLAGLALGLLIYLWPAAMQRLRRIWPICWIARLLDRWLYFGAVNRWLAMPIIIGTSRAVAALDRYLLGGLANLPAGLIHRAVSKMFQGKRGKGIRRAG